MNYIDIVESPLTAMGTIRASAHRKPVWNVPGHVRHRRSLRGDVKPLVHVDARCMAIISIWRPVFTQTVSTNTVIVPLFLKNHLLITRKARSTRPSEGLEVLIFLPLMITGKVEPAKLGFDYQEIIHLQ